MTLNTAPTPSPSDAAPSRASLRTLIKDATDELGINAAFSLGRRETDLLVVHLRGKRKRVLALPSYILDTYPAVNVELIRSSSDGAQHTLTLVVTQALAVQTPSVLERRAKLQRLCAEAEAITKF